MGAGEILLIMVVILLLFGAERLPAMARSLGKALDEFRRSARDLTHDLMDSHPSRPEPSNLPSVKTPSESPADKVKDSSQTSRPGRNAS